MISQLAADPSHRRRLSIRHTLDRDKQDVPLFRPLDRAHLASAVMSAAAWIPTQSVALCGNTPGQSGRDPSTTKLYDRRGYYPEKAASFLATY
jgi:hypothetical protein